MNRLKFLLWITAILISAGLSSLASGEDVKPPNVSAQEEAPLLKEMTEQEIREARKSFESTALQVRRKLEIYDRRDIQSEDQNDQSLAFGTSNIPEIIELLKEAAEIAPQRIGFREEDISRRDQIVTLFRKALIAKNSFPDETRLWAHELSVHPPDSIPKNILLWWEHNEKAVTSGKYPEAKWLAYSRASKSDEHFAANLEREVQVAAEVARRDGLPYAHLEAELAELRKTHDARVKRRAELRLQWEKEVEAQQISDRANQIRQQKEREKRRQLPPLSSPERKATGFQHEEKTSASAPTSNILRWSPLAAIPIFGGIYLLLRKRFFVSR